MRITKRNIPIVSVLRIKNGPSHSFQYTYIIYKYYEKRGNKKIKEGYYNKSKENTKDSTKDFLPTKKNRQESV